MKTKEPILVNLQITQTYDLEKGKLDYSIIEEKTITTDELPSKLLELARRASEHKHNQNVVLSFPDDDTNTILVEIYNGYRE